MNLAPDIISILKYSLKFKFSNHISHLESVKLDIEIV
jgi:hypothetical protein